MKNKLSIIALVMLFNMNTQTNHRTNGVQNPNFGTGGTYNTASGVQTLDNNSSGDKNTASGYEALTSNTTGSNNTASGVQTLYNNIGGHNNTAMGYMALYKNENGIQNTGLGVNSLHSNTSGEYNTAVGFDALKNNITGDNNTALGYNTLLSHDNAKNQTVIGYETTGVADHSVTLGNASVTAVYMAEDSGATIYAAGLRTDDNAVLTLSDDDATFADNVTVNGDVTVASDARLKANIVSLGATLAKLLLIDGKTYTLKKDGKQKIGLLAQDIQKVFPELVHKNDNEMLAVNYQGLVPVLINALKEQDDKMKKQEGKLKEQDAKMKEQDDKISRLERLVEKFMVSK